MSAISLASIIVMCLTVTAVLLCCQNKAKLTGRVVLYTSVPTDIINKVKAEFEAKHPGITLEVFRAGTTKVMKRIRKEADTGKLGADVIWRPPGFLLIGSSPGMGRNSWQKKWVSLPLGRISNLPRECPLQQLRVIPSDARKVYRNKADVKRIFKDIFSGKRIEDIKM